jgi:hypothetical protein
MTRTSSTTLRMSRALSVRSFGHMLGTRGSSGGRRSFGGGVLYVDTVAVALSAYIVAATAFGGYAGLGSRAGLDSNREFHGSGPDSKAGTTEDPKED